VLRLYESSGRKISARIALGWEPSEVFECNLLEEDRCPVSIQGNEINAAFGAYEIKSYYLRK